MEGSANIELTDKQRRFCEEYVIDWNASRAAKAAGYSDETARQIAYENLTKPYIQAYITEIQKDLAKLAGVSALRNVLELKKLAYSNLAMFKEDWMTEKEFSELTDDQKACLSEIVHTTKTFDGTTESIVKFKLFDKMRAIEIINKMLGFNSAELLDVSTKGDKLQTSPTIIVNSEETRKEYEAIIERFKESPNEE